MQVSVETTSGLERRMTVQIPADQIDQQVQSKLQQLTHTVRMDGFRPGKVPLSVVKKRYESQVRQETAGELIASSYEEALQQENLKPAGEPNIDQLENAAGQELKYVATFEVFPDIEPPVLSELVIDRKTADIAESDIENMLEKLRKQRATWERVERAAAMDDRLEIDFEGSIDGEAFSGNAGKNTPLELGSKTMIPGFEEQLVGAREGDEPTIEVTFPADYAGKEVAGKTAQFKIRVNSVSQAALPELNDEFARAFGVGDEGIDRLREEIRNNMERELKAAVKSALKQQVFDALLERANIDVPASLLDSETEVLIKKDSSGADAGIDRSQYQEEAKRRVSLGLLIAEIIQQNQLQVDPERVRETIEILAQSYEKPEEVVQWYYSNQEMLSGVQTMVMEDVVVDWIVSQAKVEDKTTSFDEIMQP